MAIFFYFKPLDFSFSLVVSVVVMMMRRAACGSVPALFLNETPRNSRDMIEIDAEEERVKRLSWKMQCGRKKAFQAATSSLMHQ